MTAHRPYVGRFAPSPTGPLHFGSLVAAVGSFLDARSRAGRWLLRIEDVDAPRAVPGAADGILKTLERFGLDWDGDVVWQSARLDQYRDGFERLKAAGHVFPCACTRREIADSALARDGSRIYPGTCRGGLPPGRRAHAWRVRVGGRIEFDDRIQGHQEEDLATEVGDFVVLRGDGQFAYQLAVVVDDAAAGVTDVVRGADLLGSTGRQIHLQHLLGHPTPTYAHLPVVVNAAGEKLSKQTLALPVDDLVAPDAWLGALAFLGQNPPAALRGAALTEIRRWALDHWSPTGIPRQAAGPPGPA
ncbi:tRNA glutamyl-Q(34) synthetase GluQRS [Aromatoleum sp.]|uniref:tRNA glutamyl-Q(34) synthetase GluQRS n=1 Tax=Aromatoleum sp. TaxID=2307007 RepID=UPI002FC9FA24